MTPEEHFDIWAPPGPESRWSDWVKPVIFAHLNRVNMNEVDARGHQWPDLLPQVPPWDDGWAAVVDLPGEESMIVGAQFARAGYRPVPLYNSAPGGPMPIVDCQAVMARLAAFTLPLWELRLPRDAPPVFLLDSERRGGRFAPTPGRFDNRSFCFATDLPSSNYMLGHGVQRVLLVTRSSQPQDDLAHALYHWQAAGVELFITTPQDAAAPQRCRVNRPAGLRSVLWRLMQVFGLRRHTLGGFGALVPEPGSSAGGGWRGGIG